jgi:AcrR family transcriptional regulator
MPPRTSSSTDRSEPTLRADARRNRARVLEVAHTAFTAEGLSVSIADIARRAGVSTGTVSRHFPTKAALIDAVIYSLFENIVADARAALADDDPGGAFFAFFVRLIEMGTTNKALFDTLSAGGKAEKTAIATIAGELHLALGALLERAQQAGAVRRDLTPDDVEAALVGALAAQARAGHAEASQRLVAVACDGLRGPRSRTSHSSSESADAREGR